MNALLAPQSLDALADRAPLARRNAVRTVLTILRQMRNEADDPTRRLQLIRLELKTAADWVRKSVDGGADLLHALNKLREEFTAYREAPVNTAPFNRLAQRRVFDALAACEAALVAWAAPAERTTP